jgi:helicase-like protein
MTYVPHRPWLAHQAREFEESKDAEYRALWWQQRCMKTQPIIDTFLYNCDLGRVTAMLVVAYPSGARLIWTDELEVAVSPERRETIRALAWKAGKMRWIKDRRGRWIMKGPYAADMEKMLEPTVPTIFSINCESLTTDTMWRYLRRFVEAHRVIVVADEDFATQWNARTKRLLWLRDHSVMRRWITGTPAEEKPTDLFYPSEFLKRGLLGFSTKIEMRNCYAEMDVGQRFEGIDPRTGERIIREYPIFKSWRNLDELRTKLTTFGSRMLRSDISDAPAQVHQTRYFQLSVPQRTEYDRLRDRYIIELQSGQRDAANVLKRMTRLQMVSRNFWPPERIGSPCRTCGSSGFDDEGNCCERCDGIGITVQTTELERIDRKDNPALAALADEVRRARAPIIVWCRFRQEVEDVWAEMKNMGLRCATYYGGVGETLCERAYRGFRDGELDVIVATEKSGLSRGKDCSNAQTVIYYSNEFSGRDRDQSLARSESLLKKKSTDVIDLVAEDTRDLDVINALRSKRSIAAMITGDRDVSSWI